MQIFGSSGTRGRVGTEFTPEFVVGIAAAAATELDAARIAIGRDTRTTSPTFADAAAAGVAGIGTDVARLGVVPTPGVARYCAEHGVPGIVVTASHNPPAYNGIKLLGADGSGLSVATLERVESHLLNESFDRAGWETVGTRTRVSGAADAYADDVIAALDGDSVAEADLTVAVDPGHGAGCDVAPRVYRELGCEVVTLNAQPDGRFPGRSPEPVPDELRDLERLVRARDADVGVAHDGDADRAVFVDETGTVVPAEASLAALAERAATAGDTVVSAVNVSQRLVDACERVGAQLELTPIGATNITTRVQELWDEGRRVPLAGEGNGGVFYPDYRLARDGAFVAGKFLELLAETDRTASEIAGRYADYHAVRHNLGYDTEADRDAMLAAAERFAERERREAAAEITTIDGYRLDYGDAWVLVRPSGTEPKVRVYAESDDPERAAELADAARDALRSAVE
ncbi:MAG: phosphoglucosamine mutase [Halobaculum sp.]